MSYKLDRKENYTFRLNNNSIKSLRSLGKQPFVTDNRGNPQCGHNLRFIFQESENPRSREILRRAFGNDVIRFKNKDNFFPQKSARLTPFRIAFNAGDTNAQHLSIPDEDLQNPPPNQINRPSMNGNRLSLGDGINVKKNGSYYSGNPSFVYDGSDYTRYKKLAAINRNYRDITFGGDEHNASQTAKSQPI